MMNIQEEQQKRDRLIAEFKQLAYQIYMFKITLFVKKQGSCEMYQRPFKHWVFPVRFNFCSYEYPDGAETIFAIESFYSDN